MRNRRVRKWTQQVTSALLRGAAILAIVAGCATRAGAQTPDPAGITTGDKTSVADAAGNSFVVTEPTDKSAPDYAQKKKAYDEFQAQSAKEPLAVKLADSVGHVRIKKPDISMACNGMLAGLVAITAPCGFVSAGSSIVIGILAGLLVCAGVLFNDRVLKVDDPCGAISVHGYCGWLGAVCVGIFADGVYGAGWNGVGATTYLGQAGLGVTGLLHGDKSQFICQLFGATLCAAYAFGGTYAVFSVVNAIKPLRVTPEVELEGLDIPQFGGLAYPEDALAAAE